MSSEPIISVVIPVYNVEAYVRDCVASVLAQTWRDFEILVIDDASPDRSVEIVESLRDARIRVIRQENRGLAGARNTGIRNARGRYIALLDGDDCWLPDKLARHIEHLEQNPAVGVSFSRSEFMDATGRRTGAFLWPKLRDIRPEDLLCDNPVGNGSAPVIRREVFEDVSFPHERGGVRETWYFDETLRRAEDCECWVRIATRTSWRFEGINAPLTLYRVNAQGLSANLDKQYEALEQVLEKVAAYAPDLIARHGAMAGAQHAKYIARTAIRQNDGDTAVEYINMALRRDARILIREPRRTLLTLVGAYLTKWGLFELVKPGRLKRA